MCFAPGTFHIAFGCGRPRRSRACLVVLAAHAGVGVDQQDRTRRDQADASRDRWRWPVVREDRRGSGHHGAHRPPDQPSRGRDAVLLLEVLSEPDAGALGHDRLQTVRLRRGLDHDLAADREAEAADPLRVDVGTSAEEVDGGEEIAISGPTDGSPSLPPSPRGRTAGRRSRGRISIRASLERVAPGKRSPRRGSSTGRTSRRAPARRSS